MPTRERFPLGGQVRVRDGVRLFGGRVGVVIMHNPPEVGVRFGAGDSAVWFRAAELEPLGVPAGGR